MEPVEVPGVGEEAFKGHNLLFTADCHNVSPNFLQVVGRPSQLRRSGEMGPRAILR